MIDGDLNYDHWNMTNVGHPMSERPQQRTATLQATTFDLLQRRAYDSTISCPPT